MRFSLFTVSFHEYVREKYSRTPIIRINQFGTEPHLDKQISMSMVTAQFLNGNTRNRLKNVQNCYYLYS